MSKNWCICPKIGAPNFKTYKAYSVIIVNNIYAFLVKLYINPIQPKCDDFIFFFLDNPKYIALLLEIFTSQTMEEFNLLSDLDDVVNLSSNTLSDAEKSVLKYSLKFCPTPGEPHIGETRCNLDRFHCSLRLKCHFGKDHNHSLFFIFLV